MVPALPFAFLFAAIEALHKAAARREFDVVMVWSVDRLGRSLQDLVAYAHRSEDQKHAVLGPFGGRVFGGFFHTVDCLCRGSLDSIADELQNGPR
jgi:hypothetical protein